MKKFLAVILAVFMLLALVSCSSDTTLIEDDELAVADNKITNNDGLGYFTYEINRDGHYSITGYETTSAKQHAIKIPESIEDISVTGIAAEAFKTCTNLTSIEIPSTVTFIEDLAFYGCDTLVELTIPESVTEIGKGAFRECTSLRTISIPTGVTEYADELFWGCVSLENIKLDNATKIGDGAFYNCDSFTKVVIGNNVVSIGDSAFYGCDALSDITINATNEELVLGSAIFADIMTEKVSFKVDKDSSFAEYFETYYAANPINYAHYEITLS